MMYPARGGLVWGQMRGCYLKLESTPPYGGLYNTLSLTNLSNLWNCSVISPLCVKCCR